MCSDLICGTRGVVIFFQERFKSEPVEDERYLLAVMRYICQNPVRAQLCSHPQDYRWSSYQEYLGFRSECTDTDVVLRLFNLAPHGQIRGFQEFVNENTTEQLLTERNKRRMDSELQKTMTTLCGTSSSAAFQNLEISTRDSCLRLLKREGFSLRQISRATGIPIGIVRNK
jgi:hypothetical protein